jgi:hypothetical protein
VVGVELTEKTDAPGQPAGRGSHKALEGRALALPQKGAIEEGRTILFVDQSGFYLLPAVVRTYAPVGQTPVSHEQLSHDSPFGDERHHSGDDKLLMMEQERAFIKGPDVVRFLKHALRRIPGKLFVIWDGSPIHRSKVVPQVRGAQEERLLPEPLGVEAGVAQSQGALEAQEAWSSSVASGSRDSRFRCLCRDQ